MQAWKIAALGNDPTKQAIASLYCNEVLSNDPPPHSAIIWSLARRFDVALRASELALEVMVRTGKADVIAIGSLSAIYLSKGKTAKASKLLESTQDLFVGDNAVAFWQSRKAL